MTIIYSEDMYMLWQIQRRENSIMQSSIIKTIQLLHTLHTFPTTLPLFFTLPALFTALLLLPLFFSLSCFSP